MFNSSYFPDRRNRRGQATITQTEFNTLKTDVSNTKKVVSETRTEEVNGQPVVIPPLTSQITSLQTSLNALNTLVNTLANNPVGEPTTLRPSETVVATNPGRLSYEFAQIQYQADDYTPNYRVDFRNKAWQGVTIYVNPLTSRNAAGMANMPSSTNPSLRQQVSILDLRFSDTNEEGTFFLINASFTNSVQLTTLDKDTYNGPAVINPGQIHGFPASTQVFAIWSYLTIFPRRLVMVRRISAPNSGIFPQRPLLRFYVMDLGTGAGRVFTDYSA